MNDGADRATDGRRRERQIVMLLALNMLYASWVATEVLAWRLGFHRNLGAPTLVVSAAAARWWRLGAVVLAASAVAAMFARRCRQWAPLLLVCGGAAWCLSLGHVYGPQRLIVWAFAYRHVAALVPMWRWAEFVFAGAMVCAVAATLGLVLRRRKRDVSDAYGTAEWGEPTELALTGGVLVGRAPGSADARPLLRYDGGGHCLTLAPSRAGKGVGVIVPNLLTYSGSVLVTDLKGENCAVSARWRESGLGQTVHALDPFGLVGGAARFNPMAMIDARSPDAYDDAAMLADMLVVHQRGDAMFWTEEARALLTGLILHVATSEEAENRTLARVRQRLTARPDQFDKMLEEMSASKAAWGLPAREAHRQLQKDPAQRAGVVASAQSQTHFLDSPRMTTVMGASSFAWESLKTGWASVYLVLPPERLPVYRRWVRLMLACALGSMLRVAGQPAEPVLFLLDEFAQLGRLGPVETAVRVVAGYGVRLWLFVQDFPSLRDVYEESADSFVANAGLFQAFGANDKQTAEYLSTLTGEATILVTSESRSHGVTYGRTGSSQEGSGDSTSERGRRLLLPDEVRRLGAGEQLIFLRHRRPYRVRMLDYRMEPEMAGRASDNPMYQAVVGA